MGWVADMLARFWPSRQPAVLSNPAADGYSASVPTAQPRAASDARMRSLEARVRALESERGPRVTGSTETVRVPRFDAPGAERLERLEAAVEELQRQQHASRQSRRRRLLAAVKDIPSLLDEPAEQATSQETQ